MKIDAQLGLVNAGVRRTGGRSRGAQIVPGDLFGLAQKRRQISEARADLLAIQRAVQELVHAGNGLASATMGHDAGEALDAVMEGAELGSRPVIAAEVHGSRFHSKITFCG
jgi:hypothetical protein